MLFLDGGFILFGGRSTSPVGVIARLDSGTTSWSKLGELRSSRYQHNVIYDGEVFMVIGGNNSNLKSEKCSLSRSTMTCTEQAPALTSYMLTPALVMVPEDFCTEICTDF